MSDKQQIIVRVAPDGAILAETIGIKGDSCLDYVELLESLLEATTVDSVFTAEYHQSPTVSTNEVNRDVQQW